MKKKKRKILSQIKTDGNEGFWKIPTQTTGEISLYFHIPFCRKKCPYCHFYVLRNLKDSQLFLFQALLNEIQQKSSQFEHKKIISIYFGGGTPILFESNYLKNILEKIASITQLSKDIEITIEVNPEEVKEKKISELINMGFNRFSMGVQTLDDTLLQKIGRSHSAKDIIEALILFDTLNVENVSIDLMYDLPEQTLQSFKNTLNDIQNLPITHLSLYNLTIEPNTPFFRKRKTLNLPSSETSFQMHEMAIEKMEEIGLKRYEISAFAKDMYYSRHNVGYWIQRPYLGFGPSAFSFNHGKRFRNVPNLNEYIEATFNGCSSVDFEEDLPVEQKMREAFAIELRLIEGVQIHHFKKKWGHHFETLSLTLDHLLNNDFIEKVNNRIKLTSKGLLFYDTVASEII